VEVDWGAALLAALWGDAGAGVAGGALTCAEATERAGGKVCTKLRSSTGGGITTVLPQAASQAVKDKTSGARKRTRAGIVAIG
jgi:hypothetical protein